MVPDPPGAEMGGPSDAEPLIFVSDASAEAERLTTALRVRGYVVVDVPLSLVVSRAAVQRPSLILCDVDADDAIGTMARLRDVPGGSGVDIIFLGEAGGTLDDMPDAVFHEGSGFFVRPVDVYALLRKVEALVGPPLGAGPSSMLPSSARGALLPSQIPYGPSSGRPGGRISSSPPRMPSSHPSSVRPAPGAAGANRKSNPPAAEDAASNPPAAQDGGSNPPAAEDAASNPPAEEQTWPKTGDLDATGPAAPTAPPPRSPQPPRHDIIPPVGPGPVTYEPAAPQPPAVPSIPAPVDTPSESPSLPPPVPLGFGVDGESTGSPLARQIPQSEMSPELERLLARAEQRLGQNTASSNPPSRLTPDEEVEAVLPAEVLASLDEPLDHDADDDADESSAFGTRSGSESGGTGLGAAAGTGAINEPRGGFATSGDVPLSTPSEPAPAQTFTATGARTVAGGSLFPPSENLPASDGDRAPSVDYEEVTPPAVPARGSWVPTGPGAPGTSVESHPDGARSVAPGTPADSSRGGVQPPAPTPVPPSVLEPLQKRRTAPPQGIAGGVPPNMAVTAPPPHPGQAVDVRFSPAAPPPMAPPAPPVAPRVVSPAAPSVPEIPTALGLGDAVRALARAVRARYTGALAVEDDHGIRRVVMRDGDLITAASGTEGESLVAFLAQRGVLTQDVAAQLGRKLAQFGRHAGAALIAHGHLRQDELWPVLRAHAEWIVGRVIEVEHGALSLEKDLPGRLQAEPAVFGGATGAEVLVEVVRRSVPPQEAIRRMGGPAVRFADGPAASLLGECALVEADVALVNRAKSSSIQELLENARSDDPAPMLYALVELGVLAVLSPSTSARQEASAPGPPQTDELDEEALRARIEARMALVREGDYFAVLGINRGATGYDIRRAYLDLRRQFEPNRILSARTADLRDDVDVICEVLDEAYDVLRDQVRRDRYRRALDATPH